MAGLLRLPGKLGFSGAQVWSAYLAGHLDGIRRYCETDVLNTYLIYLRFELMRARLTRERYTQEVERVRTYLRSSPEPHFAEFLQAWEAAP
jgi:3'-5' exonuclease